jgi:hypothetical protein
MWSNCEREKKGHDNGRKGLSVNCVGKERKWIVQIVWGLRYILLFAKHFPESYIIDIYNVLKLRLENTNVCFIKADQI